VEKKGRESSGQACDRTVRLASRDAGCPGRGTAKDPRDRGSGPLALVLAAEIFFGALVHQTIEEIHRRIIEIDLLLGGSREGTIKLKETDL